MSTTRADRTAIRRTALSRPVALALDDGLVHRERTFFDYGCGDDLLRLHKLGIPVSGWDPAFFPDEERTPADIVNLGYVVNVIEDPDDIRAFFGSYRSGCMEADALLLSAGEQDAVDRACRDATVGKLLPDALYVHHSAVEHLPPVLRVYEGCGRQLAGAVHGLTLIKLFRRRARVSYLAYEDFDRVAHPALRSAIVADLKRLDLHFRDYTRSANPPVLHRKELFVTEDYAARARFARLTAREESLGLLAATSTIGTRDGWQAVLAEHGVSVRGHSIMRNVPDSRP